MSRWLVLEYSCQPLAGCQLGHWVVAKATCSDQVNRKDMHAAQMTTFPCLKTSKINGWNLGQSGWWGIWYPLLHMRWEICCCVPHCTWFSVHVDISKHIIVECEWSGCIGAAAIQASVSCVAGLEHQNRRKAWSKYEKSSHTRTQRFTHFKYYFNW
jgi:hypothetical protein